MPRDLDLRDFYLSGRDWCVLLFSRPCRYDLVWFGFGAGHRYLCCRLSRWQLLPNAFGVSHDFCIDSVKRSRRPSLSGEIVLRPYLT